MSFLFGEIESEDLNASAVGGGFEGDRSQCERQGAREGVAVEMHRAKKRGKHFGHRKLGRRKAQPFDWNKPRGKQNKRHGNSVPFVFISYGTTPSRFLVS